MTKEWNDDRMDIIGQNGNDGLHYDANKKIEVNYAFIEKIYEIAFGDNAINRDFSEQDVIEALEENSNALHILQGGE